MYELGLAHAERAGDPAEELEVGAEVEVDDPAGAAVVAGAALAGDVELGEVDAVVDGLDAEHGEEQQEDEGPQDVDEGRHPEVLQRRHGRGADGPLVAGLSSAPPPSSSRAGACAARKEGGRREAGIEGAGAGVVV